ncbi:MAG: ATP-dependent zinc protease [Campylobacterales bacterium]|nr:ATP-dependent zinc protease [Campylobacterales bacterium]
MYIRTAAFSLISLVTLFFAGCSNAQIYSSKADIENLDHKIQHVHTSLQRSLSDIEDQHRKEFEAVRLEHDAFMAFMTTQFEEARQDNNSMMQFIEEFKRKSEPAKLVVAKKKNKAPKYLHEKILLGAVENVRVTPPDLVYAARIDSGAETSSIDARDIEEFERDGEKWVKFNLVDRSNSNVHPIETKILRHVKIKQSSQDETTERRIVVQLKLGIGDISELSEFTLTSREHLEFSLLIGRNILKDIAIVDVSDDNLAPLKPQTEKKQ